MTKAEIIQHYGIEHYEAFKAKQRKYAYDKYHADPEKARACRRENDAKHRKHKTEYARSRRAVYRINARDNQRLASLGLLKDGYEIHHIKYHADNKDPTWIDDIVLMTREEHRRWHYENPDFNALEHIV